MSLLAPLGKGSQRRASSQLNLPVSPNSDDRALNRARSVSPSTIATGTKGVFSLTTTGAGLASSPKYTLKVSLPEQRLPPLGRLPTPSTCRTDIAGQQRSQTHLTTQMTVSDEMKYKGSISEAAQKRNLVLRPILEDVDKDDSSMSKSMRRGAKGRGGVRSIMDIRKGIKPKKKNTESTEDDDDESYEVDPEERRKKQQRKENNRALKELAWKINSFQQYTGGMDAQTFAEMQQDLKSSNKKGISPTNAKRKMPMSFDDSDSDLSATEIGGLAHSGTQRSFKKGFPEGDDLTFVPTFKDGTHSKKKQHEPRAYIAKTIFNLRSNPLKWREFTEKADELEEIRTEGKLREQNNRGRDALRENIYSVMSNSPSRTSEARSVKRREDALHRRQVVARHEARLADFIGGVMTAEKKKEVRHRELASKWIEIVAFAARCNVFAQTLAKKRWEEDMAQMNQSACLIQRTFRWKSLGKRAMTHLSAFLIRARFLRRVLTRVRVKLRDVYTERALAMLRKIDFNARALAAFRSFGTRVKKIQFWWKQKHSIFQFEKQLRLKQWSRQVAVRAYDLSLLIQKFSADAKEKGLATTKQLENTTSELDALNVIPDDLRDKLLEEYLSFYEKEYLEKLAKWEEKLHEWNHSAARWRSARPQRPHRRKLLPKEILEVMVKNAARDFMDLLQKQAKEAELEAALSAAMGNKTPGSLGLPVDSKKQDSRKGSIQQKKK